MEEPITPAEEVNKTEEAVVETKVENKTVGEVLEDKGADTVPLKTFLEVKKEKKDLEKTVSDLQAQVKAGTITKSEVKAELKDVADKYDVDANFLSELTTLIYADVEQSFNSKLKPLEEKEKAERINTAFEEHYNKVIEEMPEYADVINKNAIKALSLLPENSKKTFQQIIEETYGKTVTGKRTMETSTPRGGKETSIDMNRMRDPEYYKEVMANPELKKKYNENLHTRINL